MTDQTHNVSYAPDPAFAEQANAGPGEYDRASADRLAFWDEQARRLDWNTEWTETLEDGWNILDPDLTQLSDVIIRPVPTSDLGQPYGDGHAADRAIEALVNFS